MMKGSLTLIATVLLCACSFITTPLLAATLRIGVALPKSEKRDGRHSIENALELFSNDLNGSLGRDLKRSSGFAPPNVKFEYLFFGDGESSKAAEYLAGKEDVAAVIGFTTSSDAVEAGKQLPQELAMISPTATNPAVTSRGKNIFSMMYSDDWQGAVIAAYLEKVLGSRRVLIIFQKNIYGEGLRKSFTKQARILNMDVVKTIAILDQPELEPRAVRAKWPYLEKPLDAIVLFTYMKPGIEIVSRIREFDRDTPIVGADALSYRDFKEGVKNLGLDNPRVLVANSFFFELAPTVSRSFRDRYTQRFHRAPSTGPLFAYDAATMITSAAMQAMKDEKEKRPLSGRDLRRAVLNRLRDATCRLEAVRGLSGDLFFISQGNLHRNVLFGWIQGDDWVPAYLQLKDVSTDTCKENAEYSPIPITAGQSNNRSRNTNNRDDDTIMVNGRQLRVIHVVRVGLDFFRINDVSITSQKFDVEVFLWFKWKGPFQLFDAADAKNVGNQLLFWNGIYGIEDKTDVLYDDRNRGIKQLVLKVKGTYVKHFDLKSYPFDTQLLSLKLSLPRHDTDRVWLVVDEASVQKTEKLRDRQADGDFKIFPKEYTAERLSHFAGTTTFKSSLGRPLSRFSQTKDPDFSVYEASIELSRDLFPYMVKMFLPLGILTIVALGAFWISVERFETRITVLLTALLSDIVLHLSRAESLPNVGYMTVADKFFVASYIGMSISVIVAIYLEFMMRTGRIELARHLNMMVRFILWWGTAIAIFVIGYPVIEKNTGLTLRPFVFMVLAACSLLFTVTYLKYLKHDILRAWLRDTRQWLIDSVS